MSSLPLPRILIMDTSVLLELLQVPRKSQLSQLTGVRSQLSGLTGRDQVVIGFTTLIETGNHIGQLTNGTDRRTYAQRLQKLIADALKGEAPFAIDLRPNTDAEIKALIDDFDQWALNHESGLGDKSLVELWKLLKLTNGKNATVTIWSFDQHLQGYSE